VNTKVLNLVCAKSAGARCAIYSRDTAIRIYSVPRFRRKKPFVKIPSWDKVMGLAEYFCRPLLVWISPNMAILVSWAKPYVVAPGAGLAGTTMGAQA
jgi:hypothetical protein